MECKTTKGFQGFVFPPAVESRRRMKLFQTMNLWVDPQRRAGPEAMAVDEWLLETAQVPLLRVYRWAGDWASIGYFGEIVAARAAFPGVEIVRRWTGGGMVDHREDWTYSLIVPHGEPLAGVRGAESYRTIHAALAEVLKAEGIAARMSRGDEETGAALCFQNPVSHDLVGHHDQKLAGAGQRRTRLGLLHQGSVATKTTPETRATHFAEQLASQWQLASYRPDVMKISARAAARYALPAWTERR